MGYLSALTIQAQELWPEFEQGYRRAHPNGDIEALRSRYASGIILWRGAAVVGHDAVSGAYKVRCERPERTKAGDPMWYWTRPAGRESTCDCADATFRRQCCKHLIAVYFYRRLGAAPAPWRRKVEA